MGGLLYRFDHQGPSGRPRRAFFAGRGCVATAEAGAFSFIIHVIV